MFTTTKDDKLDGLRSRRILVKGNLVLRSDSKKLILTARALNSLKAKRENELDEERRVQIKTWLGLSYDRPAQPFQRCSCHRERGSRVWVYFENEHELRIFDLLRSDC